MRDDSTRAASSLRLLGDAIRTCPKEHRARISAYVVKLARLARDNPLIRSAVVEAARREQADEEALKTRIKELSDRTGALFRKLANLVAPQPPDQSPLGEPARKTLVQHRSLKIRTTAPESFVDVNKAMFAGTPVVFAPADVTMFVQNFVAKSRDALASLADDDPEVDDVLSLLDDLASLGGRADALIEVDELMKRSSIGRIGARLDRYAAHWDARLSPSSTGNVTSDGIEHDIPFFVESIGATLQEGTVRLFALHRLRVLFEHFDDDALRISLAAAESATNGREKLLQEAMDRFLFLDGYFPLTHSSASRGFTDTLLLESAETYGVPPILVELKQVTAFADPSKASRAAVVAAIGTARGEVERYRGHIATRPQWGQTLPVILVVHTCVEDLSDLEASDVVLIDLSTATPSKKRRRSDTHAQDA